MAVFFADTRLDVASCPDVVAAGSPQVAPRPPLRQRLDQHTSPEQSPPPALRRSQPNTAVPERLSYLELTIKHRASPVFPRPANAQVATTAGTPGSYRRAESKFAEQTRNPQLPAPQRAALHQTLNKVEIPIPGIGDLQFGLTELKSNIAFLDVNEDVVYTNPDRTATATAPTIMGAVFRNRHEPLGSPAQEIPAHWPSAGETRPREVNARNVAEWLSEYFPQNADGATEFRAPVPDLAVHRPANPEVSQRAAYTLAAVRLDPMTGIFTDQPPPLQPRGVQEAVLEVFAASGPLTSHRLTNDTALRVQLGQLLALEPRATLDAGVIEMRPDRVPILVANDYKAPIDAQPQHIQEHATADQFLAPGLRPGVPAVLMAVAESGGEPAFTFRSISGATTTLTERQVAASFGPVVYLAG